MKKILVIEDDSSIRNEVLTWLTLENYEALGAADGAEGVELVQQQRPDLIICDIMMPKKDGYRVLLEVRTQPATALISFIFLSAKQEQRDIRYGMELGADDYISKPFARDEFLRAIESRLARQKLYTQDAERQINLLRQNLLRTLPHELRTPLVGILGIGELLAQDAETLTPTEIIDYATMITNGGRQLYRLVENYLLYSQLERLAADPAQSALLERGSIAHSRDLIRETSERIAMAYERLGDLQLRVQSAVVQITAQDLTKIVHELADNAFKFSKPEAPVQVSAAIEDGKYVIVVADQGRGIAPENLVRIDAYVQFERTRYEQQGAGLGLTIVRRLVELAGGAFQIESAVDQGTVVRVALLL